MNILYSKTKNYDSYYLYYYMPNKYNKFIRYSIPLIISYRYENNNKPNIICPN